MVYVMWCGPIGDTSDFHKKKRKKVVGLAHELSSLLISCKSQSWSFWIGIGVDMQNLEEVKSKC